MARFETQFQSDEPMGCRIVDIATRRTPCLLCHLTRRAEEQVFTRDAPGE